MSTQFDALEHQLNTLRAARLPVTTRQSILHEMEQPLAGHRSASWRFAHRAVFQVALAGAVSRLFSIAPWAGGRSTFA